MLRLSLEDYDLLKGLGGSDYIFAMHKWHYHPGIEALRLVGQSGEIGAVEEVFTVRHAWVDDFHGGDVFWTQAVHDLTIIKHLIGYIVSIGICDIRYKPIRRASWRALKGSGKPHPLMPTFKYPVPATIKELYISRNFMGLTS